METFPVNAVIFADYFRYRRIFRKLGENSNRHERIINKESLEESLEIMGLDLDHKELQSCLGPMEDFTIKAINAKPPNDILDPPDEKIPYDWT
jgi:hypothetical protein